MNNFYGKGLLCLFLTEINFRVMKLVLIMLTIVLFNVSASETYAQSTRIDLNMSNSTVKEVLKGIESKSEFTFFYNDKAVNTNRIVSINAENKRIDEILAIILPGYSYRVENKKIILVPLSEAELASKQQKSRTLTGKVADSTGEPVVGANVSIKGTTTGTITDMNGDFSIPVPGPVTLLVTYIGYSPTEMQIKDQQLINITLKEDLQALEEVVVVGYGTQRKKDITGAVSQVSEKLIKEVPVKNLNEALQGRAAGVQVSSGNHAPGGKVSILIRGKSSISQSNEPIYVVDGVIMQGTLDNINPDDIQSIDILKDASSAAIYGSRAANGVVIVTTKKGTSGTSRISYDGYVGYQTVLNTQKMLNARQLADIRIEGMANQEMDKVMKANPSISQSDYISQFDALKKGYWETLPSFSEVERNTLKNGESYNWFDQIAQTGITQNHSLSFSGGTDKSSYYISGNYLNQKGVLIGSGSERFSGRINMEQKMKSWFKIGINATASHNTQDVAGATVGQGLGANPMIPFETDGVPPLDLPFYTSDGMENPVLSQKLTDENVSKRLSASTYMLVNILPELEFKTNISIDMVNNSNFNYIPRSIKQGMTFKGSATIQKESWVDWLWDNTLTYTKTFNQKHAFTGMVGLSLEKNKYEGNSSYGKGFATDLLSYKSIGGATDFPANNQWSKISYWQTASYMARLNYVYDNRYLFTLTGRYDGNSKYGINNKWSFFPSAAVAWRISEEKFMEPLTAIDDLKLRLGYGQLGNSDFSSYTSFTQVVPGVTVIGPDVTNTLQNTDQIMGNPSLKWERETQMNLGLDLTLFNGRLTFTGDIYKTINKDLVLRTPYPVTTGYLNMYTNVGELQNRGIELTIGGRIIDAAVKWDLNINWSSNRNELTSLYSGVTERINSADSPLSAGWWVGEPLGTIYTYEYLGVYQWDDDREMMDLMKDGRIGGDRYYPGDNIIKDQDGDNQITGKDRKIMGYTDPKGYGGISTTVSYKGFSLNTVFNYVYGNDVFNRSHHEHTLGAGFGFHNMKTDVMDRWTPEHTATMQPRAHANNLDRMLISSRLMEDGSYLRMKTLTLAYSFSPKLLETILLSNLRLYVTGQNLLTFTKYRGFDPETPAGGKQENYPNTKGFTFGINIGF